MADALIDLAELKMLPSWATETARPNDYSGFEGEEVDERAQHRGGRDRRERRPGRGPQQRGDRPRRDGNRDRRQPDRREPRDRREQRAPMQRSERPPRQLPPIDVRFQPDERAFANVAAQIKNGGVAYSVFALARLFLAQPERYSVRLATAAEHTLFQLGENGPVAAERFILENNAFASMRDELFAVETTQTEPLKGNFTNVARDRASGTLLGPTNYHGYQPALRSLYEQRYSRRMSFADFQRQIEVVSQPEAVEQWKEQARNVTTYVTKNGDAPERFQSAADAERYFRTHYLPTLIRTVNDASIGGVASRSLPDRALGRLIENAWTTEMRSPSRMMQELATRLRGIGLSIFRHRRGMLFVTPVRPNAIDEAQLSDSVRGIIEAVRATPKINRKQLAEKLVSADLPAEEIGKAKLALAADLRWLIREGHLIEFNDGSLDLPRAKQAPAAAETPAPESTETSAAAEVVPVEGEMPVNEQPPAELPAAPQEPSDQSAPATSSSEGAVPSDLTT